MLSIQKSYYVIGLLSMLFILSACSASQKVVSSENLLLGKWKLNSAVVDGTEIDAEMLGGGEVIFEFGGDGMATYTTPDGKSESSKYVLTDNKIFNSDAPAEDPIEIVSLLKDQLIVRMQEEGKPIVMNLVRK